MSERVLAWGNASSPNTSVVNEGKSHSHQRIARFTHQLELLRTVKHHLTVLWITNHQSFQFGEFYGEQT